MRTSGKRWDRETKGTLSYSYSIIFSISDIYGRQMGSISSWSDEFLGRAGFEPA